MTFIKHLSVIGLALSLGACVSNNPANVPVTMMGTQGIGTANEMTARAGETPEMFAKRSNMDIGSLLQMNGLVSQQSLQGGQVLKTPMPQQVTVIEGDSIDTIARAIGVSRDDIANTNGLKPPYVLQRGQVLKLPAPITSNAPSQAAEIPSNITVTDMPPTEPVVESSPIVTTQGAGGQTVHSSASGTITEEDLAPPTGAKASTMSAPMNIAAPATAASSTASTSTQIASLSPSEPAKPIATLGSGVPKFSWPVNGSTLSKYGSQSGGVQNDGLNIGAPMGTPVRASAAGEVVYVGDNIAGFGNVILIRHSGGYATAYGHIKSPTVKRGDKVSAGQAIAQVGKTGNVSTPQLHFEIRKGTQPTDPASYLP